MYIRGITVIEPHDTHLEVYNIYVLQSLSIFRIVPCHQTQPIGDKHIAFEHGILSQVLNYD